MVAVIKSGDLRFRAFKKQDIERISSIENQVYEFPWSEVIFFDCMRVNYECIALEVDEVIVGYSILTSAVGEAHLLNIAIDPECQRQGYGRILLEHMLDRARRLNARTAFLEVRISNTSAIKLYESSGFNEIAMRNNYYPGHGEREDGVIFAIAL